MNMVKIQTLCGLLGISFSFIFGAWTPLLAVLVVMTSLDIITGISKGFYNKKLRSRKMSQGMTRKAMIGVVIILANMLDIVLFAGVPVAKTGTLFFYIAMEGLSIIENLAQMNVPLPTFIKKYLLVLKQKGENPNEINNEKLNIK
ncbi:phage holin family protein [Halobacillus rhizosphaerae]|uniref:phage holin family protein n=1 Tax=Halobacillus rhizosphaerae TaxID=3064889 RepID=UPI00398A7519